MNHLSTIAICDRLSDYEDDLYQAIIGQLKFFNMLSSDNLTDEQYKAYTEAYSSLAHIENTSREGISRYSKLLGC